MQNEQWPFNGKSLWSSLTVGQRFSIILGVPIIYVMHRSFNHLIGFTECFRPLNAVLTFIGIFIIPLVYVRGLGMIFAVAIDIILKFCRK